MPAWIKRLWRFWTIPGWVLVLLAWLYRAVDTWSNVEFLQDKLGKIAALMPPHVEGALSSWWIVIVLNAVGLAWIAWVASRSERRERVGYQPSRAEKERLVTAATVHKGIIPQDSSIDRFGLLGEHRARGVALLNRKISNDMELGKWIAEQETWCREVSNLLESHFNEAAKLRFMHLGSLRDAGFLNAFNSLHNHQLLMLAERLKILGDFLEKAPL